MIAAALALVAATAGGADACDRLVSHPSPAERAAYADAVARAPGEKGPVSVGTVMTSGPWRIVWALPTEMEPGVFFFRATGAPPSTDLRLADVWGGPPESPQVVFDWAVKRLHMARPLARCVGRRIFTDGP